MGSFHNPTAGLEVRIRGFLLRFLLALLDVRLVAMSDGRLQALLAFVAGIGTKMLGAVLWPIGNHAVKGSIQQLAIMPVSAGADDRQRDATAVGKEASLASFFSPCRWDWVPRIR